MKNDIADILFKYTTGEATLEETNDALKEAEAGFNLEPGRNEITPDEMALTTVGDTPEEAKAKYGGKLYRVGITVPVDDESEKEFRNAVNSVINFFKETLTAVGSVAKSVFEGIGNVIGSVMDAAKATVSEKLSNIKTAYEEHGGGISGVAAAAMEAVKGWYTAGYTFIDNLTGGKLSEIRGKFSTAMSNIVQGISQKFTDARTAFSNGLNNIKNAVSGAVTWFFESGKRIVSTFANGIKSAFSSAVEAVKGGLQKIRNLLPFSDAKEGPLSTLTLSGQRTMTTYAHGLTLAGDAPAAAMNKSLQQVQGALDREPEKKIDLGGGKKDKDESSDEGGSGKGKQVIIHKLLVPVDLKKIKDLQQLLALLQEVEDYAAANEDGEPGDDEDAAPAPA